MKREGELERNLLSRSIYLDGTVLELDRYHRSWCEARLQLRLEEKMARAAEAKALTGMLARQRQTVER